MSGRMTRNFRRQSIEAGEVAESGVAQAPQNRLVSGFSVAQRLHFIWVRP